MNYTQSEVLEFVRENEVKFIRLGFCDIFGQQKNISIIADRLHSAFENGVPFDAHMIRGFRDITDPEMLLYPDPATLVVLPWRPGPGRVVHFFCNLKNPDGTEYENDSRRLLRKTVERCKKMGYVCETGVECEFYLFKNNEYGEPTDEPFDRGGYLDISPLDCGGDIRRDICLTLEDMGIKPQTSYHERGPGQNQVDFIFGDALGCADNFQLFKTAVKAIAARSGLFASFCPKPILDAPGNGLHVNLSLVQNGKHIFKDINEGHSEAAESFIAGILDKTPEITVFLNPLANSYERFGKFEAPKFASWSHRNHSQLISIPLKAGGSVRMELRSPDPSANPYLALALIINAGLDGIENNTKLPQAIDVDLYTADETVTKELTVLPDSLDKAIALAGAGSFAKKILGDELCERYLAYKKDEAAGFAAAEDKQAFYKDWYFGVI